MHNLDPLHARPELDLQAEFKAGDCGRLHPSRPIADLGDDAVVQSDVSSDLAQAAVADGSDEVGGNLAHDLRDGVSAGSDRPVGAVGVGSVALRPSHETTVSASASVDPTSGLELASTSALGLKYPRLDSEVVQVIASFVPTMPTESWDSVADFVREAVAAAGPKRRDTAKRWMSVVGLLAYWCHDVACIDLTYEAVFDPNVIERFIEQTPSVNPHTRGGYRSVLMAVAEELVGPQLRSYRHTPYERSLYADPYSRDELVELRSVRDHQGTAYRRLNLGVFLALGAGAGISSGEISRLRQEHITRGADAIVVEAPGHDRLKPRAVPMLAEWEDLLVPALNPTLPEALVFLPRRTMVDSKNAVNEFLSHCNDMTVWPANRRLRATWVVRHLDARTPLPDLIEAAGYDSMSKFQRFLPHLTRHPEPNRSAAMRLAGDQS